MGRKPFFYEDARAKHKKIQLFTVFFKFINRFTAADCVLGYNVWWANVMQGGQLLKNHPVARSYLERLGERDAFKKTFS